MIKNKQESDFAIKRLGLNRILEAMFTKDTAYDLQNFLKVHKHPYYNLRDKSKSAGKFLYKITDEEVLEQSKHYSLFSIYESLALADERLLLQGDIQISSDFILLASLSDIKGISNRIAMQEPKYTINIDLKEKKEPSIYGLTKVIDYIISHELFDMIVEFSMFDIPVGINKEHILIWELRNY